MERLYPTSGICGSLRAKGSFGTNCTTGKQMISTISFVKGAPILALIFQSNLPMSVYTVEPFNNIFHGVGNARRIEVIKVITDVLDQ